MTLPRFESLPPWSAQTQRRMSRLMFANARYWVRRFVESTALIAAGALLGVILTLASVRVLVDAGLVGGT